MSRAGRIALSRMKLSSSSGPIVEGGIVSGPGKGFLGYGPVAQSREVESLPYVARICTY